MVFCRFFVVREIEWFLSEVLMQFLDSDVIVVGICYRKDRKSKSCLCYKKSLEIVTYGFATEARKI